MQQGLTIAPLKALQKKALVACIEHPWKASETWHQDPVLSETPLALNAEQKQAVASVALNNFQAYLLDGVTGSGKTEVYLHLIVRRLAQGQQVLVLIPEIGLTPQTIQRFEQRFHAPVVALNSLCSDKQRAEGWLRAKHGDCAIVIGTRSAVFTFQKPGLIIVDEEHDASFKQQDTVRYHARDIAVLRAKHANIPIILAVLRPRLLRWRISSITIPTSAADTPCWRSTICYTGIVDLREQQVTCGLSQTVQAMQQQLN